MERKLNSEQFSMITYGKKLEMGEGCFENKFSWYCQWNFVLIGNTFLMIW